MSVIKHCSCTCIKSEDALFSSFSWTQVCCPHASQSWPGWLVNSRTSPPSSRFRFQHYIWYLSHMYKFRNSSCFIFSSVHIKLIPFLSFCIRVSFSVPASVSHLYVRGLGGHPYANGPSPHQIRPGPNPLSLCLDIITDQSVNILLLVVVWALSPASAVFAGKEHKHPGSRWVLGAVAMGTCQVWTLEIRYTV